MGEAKNNKQKSIFLDTSAFKAVFDEADDFHPQASNFWQLILKKQINLITSNYILDETYTLFRSQRGSAAALLARNNLASSPKTIKIIRVQLSDEANAWKYFEHLPGRGISFTDCTSFSIMERLELKEVFTFDNDFRTAGFIITPK